MNSRLSKKDRLPYHIVVLVMATNKTQPINSTEEADYSKRKRDYFLPSDADQPVLGPEHAGICTGLEASPAFPGLGFTWEHHCQLSNVFSLHTHIIDVGICLSL